MTEAELINMSKSGDQRSFARLLHPYKDRLFNYLCRYSGERETAEDILQETLIKVWKGLNNFSDYQKFSSWLFTIAHNSAIDYYRRKKLTAEERDDNRIENGSPDPAEELILKESAGMVYRALEKLPSGQRTVFILRQDSGFSFREISEITGEPLNTVISHMHYAVKKLRKQLRSIYA